MAPRQASLLLDQLKMRGRTTGGAQGSSAAFETLHAPMPVTQATSRNAFGGLSIALAIQAAYNTLSLGGTVKSKGRGNDPDQWYLYSLSGNFLGPVSTMAPVRIEVVAIRRTRSFQTFNVRIYSATMPKGKESTDAKGSRASSLEYSLRFFSTLDFCRAAPHALHPITGDRLQFSEMSEKCAKALNSGPEAFLDWKDLTNESPSAKQTSGTAAQRYRTLYAQRAKVVDMRFEPSSLLVDTLSAMLPTSATSIRARDCFSNASILLEHMWKKPTVALLPLIERNRGDDDVFHCSAKSATFAQIAFNVDPRVIGSMSVINHTPYGVAHVSASLDISIRFHVQHTNVDDWHLYETQIKDEGHARFFGETRCYNRLGQKVATASQQAAYRPLEKREDEPKSKL